MEVNGVNVGLSLSPALNGDKARLFQFTNEFRDARTAHPHVFGQPFLAGKAPFIVPGVAQEHGISDLGPDR